MPSFKTRLEAMVSCAATSTITISARRISVSVADLAQFRLRCGDCKNEWKEEFEGNKFHVLNCPSCERVGIVQTQ